MGRPYSRSVRGRSSPLRGDVRRAGQALVACVWSRETHRPLASELRQPRPRRPCSGGREVLCRDTRHGPPPHEKGHPADDVQRLPSRVRRLPPASAATRGRGCRASGRNASRCAVPMGGSRCTGRVGDVLTTLAVGRRAAALCLDGRSGLTRVFGSGALVNAQHVRCAVVASLR
jgi:hypothetical protein